jgi:hypothetical protein
MLAPGNHFRYNPNHHSRACPWAAVEVRDVSTMKTKTNFRARMAVPMVPLLACLFTGCVTFVKEREFGGQSTIQLKDGTDVGLWLSPTHEEKEFPLLLHFYSSGPPYTLQIYFPDSDPAWQSAAIDEVVVKYEDGTVHEKKGSGITWRRGKSKEMTLYRGPLKCLVTRHKDCDITVKGRILSQGGKTTRFEFTHRFDAERGKTGIVSTLWALDQAG